MLSIVTSSRHFPIIWLNECKNNNIDLRLEFCLYSWKILRSSAFFSSEKLKKYQHYFVDDHRILLTFWTEFWQKIVHLSCMCMSAIYIKMFKYVPMIQYFSSFINRTKMSSTLIYNRKKCHSLQLAVQLILVSPSLVYLLRYLLLTRHYFRLWLLWLKHWEKAFKIVPACF